MLTAEKNRLITETGRGTRCGALMRRYWQPAALVEELEGPRPVKRLRLLGEDLVLFRDPLRRYGMLARIIHETLQLAGISAEILAFCHVTGKSAVSLS